MSDFFKITIQFSPSCFIETPWLWNGLRVFWEQRELSEKVVYVRLKGKKRLRRQFNLIILFFL